MNDTPRSRGIARTPPASYLGSIRAELATAPPALKFGSTHRPLPQVMTMPRTVEEILRHADELAARFESYEPDPAHRLDPVHVGMLRDAVVREAQAERRVLEAVAAARRGGIAWSAIGQVLGTSGEAARQRYGKHVE